MNNNIQELKTKFNSISEMGWVKSICKGYCGIGYTFEHLLKKPKENFEIPDYEGIEIKTRRAFTNSCITLFNATPDGKYLFEIKRLKETYGYPDAQIKNFTVFNVSVFANKVTEVGSMYLFLLKVERKEQKIYLCIFDRNNKLIDKNTFWSFQLLEEKLYRKMQVLAVVDALYRKRCNEELYKYNSIAFYKLKNFESFIELIETGTIRITFKINVFRSGKRYGEIHDHGTGFDIKESDLEKLYDVL